jgi:hypothetical protein
LEIVAYHQLTLSYSLNNVVLTAGLGITIAPTSWAQLHPRCKRTHG